MKISVSVRGKRESSPVIIRISAGRKAVFEAPTKIFTNPKTWSKEKSKAIRPRSGDSDYVDKVNENITKIVNELERHFLNDSSQAGFVVTSQWLKDFIEFRGEAKKEGQQDTYNGKPMDLVGYWKLFIERNDIGRVGETLRKYGCTLKKVEEFLGGKKLMLEDVTRDWSEKFNAHWGAKNEGNASMDGYIRHIKAVCNHAKEKSELPFKPNYLRLERMSSKKMEKNIKDTDDEKTRKLKSSMKKAYLTVEELDVLEKYNFENKRLSDARDWLLVSCETAQRNSDFWGLSCDQIEYDEENDLHYIDRIQYKTLNNVAIVITNRLWRVLRKNGDRFPQKMVNTDYNQRLKTVCEMAGIDTEMYGGVPTKVGMKGKRADMRKIYGFYPKYKLVTSHIGRRTFATNHYGGSIPIALLMAQTGHESEAMFLKYIGRTNRDRTMQLGKILREQEITKNAKLTMKAV